MPDISGTSGIETVSWVNQFVLGGGFDLLSCKAHSSCLRLGDEEPGTTTPGQKTDLSLKVVESSTALAQSLNVSAQASASFGAYEVDAKAAVATKSAFNSNSLFVVAAVTVEDRTVSYPAELLQAVQLAPAAADLVDADPWTFQQTYGTHFVSGQVLGGELFCVVEIKTSSNEDKKSLAVSASGKGNGIKGSADLAGSMESIVSNRDVNVWIHKSGGKSVKLTKDDMTVAKFIDMVGNFPSEVADEPMPVRALLTPYDELPPLLGKPLGQSALLHNHVAGLVDRYLKYRDALVDIAYLETHQEEFIYPRIELTQIERVRAALEDQQNGILTAITKLTSVKDADQDTESATAFPLPQTLMEGLPQRRRKLPRTAWDIHEMYPHAPDGEYDLYLGGDLTSHVRLHCHDMTGMPAEYVTLHSPDNYSEWPASSTPGQKWRHGRTIRTTFSRIRISGDSGMVDLSDHTFARTEGGPLTDSGAHGSRGPTWKAADYATATASNHDSNAGHQSRQPYSTAKVDLSGTGLRMADGVVWRTSGWDFRPKGDHTPDPGTMHQMTVTVGGAPGWCAPIALQLEVDKP